ncbi:MAG: TolC family protein [Nitrospira sp.]|nr:TolC family protein [Nitrospira sp.]
MRMQAVVMLSLVGGLTMASVEVSVAGASAPSEALASVAELRLSLKDAMEAALGNNPTVKLYKERIEAAKAVMNTQLGAMLPNLSNTVRQSRQTYFLGTVGLSPFVTQPFSIFDARVNASQNLFSLSLMDRWRASREALHASEWEAEVTKFDTMAEVGMLYTEVLRAEAVVKAKEANVSLFGELTAMVRSRRGGGMGTGLDTARAESQLENERQHLAMARAEVERFKLNLLNTLGVGYDAKLTLTDDLKKSVPGIPSTQDATTLALSSRAEVKAQQQRIKSADLALRSTTNERLPSLVAQGDYGLIGNRMHNTAETYNMALMLSVPIFDGGQREGRISESRSLAQQEVFKMAVIHNRVRMEVQEAVVTLASAQDQVEIAKRGLESAMLEQELARERFTVLSAASNLELTNALFSLARARDNAIEAVYRLNASRIHLARAMGELEKL